LIIIYHLSIYIICDKLLSVMRKILLVINFKPWLAKWKNNDILEPPRIIIINEVHKQSLVNVYYSKNQTNFLEARHYRKIANNKWSRMLANQIWNKI